MKRENPAKKKPRTDYIRGTLPTSPRRDAHLPLSFRHMQGAYFIPV